MVELATHNDSGGKHDSRWTLGHGEQEKRAETGKARRVLIL